MHLRKKFGDQSLLPRAKLFNSSIKWNSYNHNNDMLLAKKKNSKGLHKRKNGYYNKAKQDVFLCFADTINSDKEE